MNTSLSPRDVPARELGRRRRARLRKARELRWRHRLKRLVRAFLASGAIAVAAVVIAAFSNGIGIGGFVLTMFAMMVTFVLFALYPRTSSLAVGNAAAMDLPALADRTQSWLEAQRRLLPPSTHAVIDLLGNQLEEFAPRLASLRETEPAAREMRELLANHLPSLVESFTSLPSALVDQPHAGSTPAAQLHAGLVTVTRQVERIENTVAGGSLDALAIRGRYLETRYDAANPDGDGPAG